MTAPGWYPDPQTPGQLRWWDGSTWTTHVAAPTASGPASGPAAPPAYGGPTGSAYGSPAGPAYGGPTAAAPYGSGPGRPGFGPGAPSAPAAPAGSNKSGWIVGGAVFVAVVLVAAALLIPFFVGRSSTATITPATTAPSKGGPSPTTIASDLSERADQAGIPVLDEEGSATHTHTLLRMTLDGTELVVPAGIGIDAKAGQITAVHTHEDTGVLHVESPHRNDVYTIGQFLTLWGVGDDDEELCATFAGGPCEVTIGAVAPTAADEATFEAFGSMPATPPTESAGRGTELAQGALIEIRLVTDG